MFKQYMLIQIQFLWAISLSIALISETSLSQKNLHVGEYFFDEAQLGMCHETTELALKWTRGLLGHSYLYVSIFDWLQGLKSGGCTQTFQPLRDVEDV